MKITYKAIEKAYNKVTKIHTYKYKKRLFDAIFWELFFEGYNIEENLIHAFIEYKRIKIEEKEINKDNYSAATIGHTGYIECFTKDNNLYICKEKDYYKDFKNNKYICKKSFLEITENKDKIFTLLNCDNLINSYINRNYKDNYFSNFTNNQIITALSIYIYLANNRAEIPESWYYCKLDIL